MAPTLVGAITATLVMDLLALILMSARVNLLVIIMLRVRMWLVDSLAPVMMACMAMGRTASNASVYLKKFTEERSAKITQMTKINLLVTTGVA
jgi:hypothetical protein